MKCGVGNNGVDSSGVGNRGVGNTDGVGNSLGLWLMGWCSILACCCRVGCDFPLVWVWVIVTGGGVGYCLVGLEHYRVFRFLLRCHFHCQIHCQRRGLRLSRCLVSSSPV